MTTPDQDLDSRTIESEHHDQHAAPSGGPEPTADEEAAAERAAPVDPEVAAAYKDQLERGAALEGEGAVDVANDGREPEIP